MTDDIVAEESAQFGLLQEFVVKGEVGVDVHEVGGAKVVHQFGEVHNHPV